MEKKKRPTVLPGTTVRVHTGCGNLYVTVSFLNGEPLEVFAALGKAGGCAMCQNEALTRAISLGLKYGIPIREYIDELRNLKCPCPSIEDDRRIESCPDAIAGVLEGILEGKWGRKSAEESIEE